MGVFGLIWTNGAWHANTRLNAASHGTSRAADGNEALWVAVGFRHTPNPQGRCSKNQGN